MNSTIFWGFLNQGSSILLKFGTNKVPIDYINLTKFEPVTISGSRDIQFLNKARFPTQGPSYTAIHKFFRRILCKMSSSNGQNIMKIHMQMHFFMGNSNITLRMYQNLVIASY